jgi:multidrug resistance efflux pump
MDSSNPHNAQVDGRTEQSERRTTLSDRVRSLRLSGRLGADPTGSGRSARIPWAICIVLLLTSVALGYKAYTTPAATPTEKPVEKTTTGDPVASSGDVVLVSKGYIIPAHRIQVSPNKVNGILEWVSPKLEEGQKFAKGDVLARIVKTDFQAHYDKAEHTLKEARARLAELENAWPDEIKQLEARRDLAGARMQIARIKLTNFKNARTGSAIEDIQNAESMAIQEENNLEDAKRALLLNKLTRKEQILQQKARIIQMEADRDEQKFLLENCEIKAPVTGMILQKNAEAGNFVNPGALNSGSGGIAVSLCDMADLTDLEVDLSIQERDLLKIDVGQPCIVMPESGQKDPRFLKVHPRGYEAKVSRILPIADRAKGSVSVRVKLTVARSEEGKFLKPDTGVIVTFHKMQEE